MAVPFVDLDAIHAPIRDRIRAAMDGVINANAFVNGPDVKAFEAEIAAWLGVPHAIGVSSGTDALLVALMALDVGPGDEVITTPYTFFATAGSIARLGARPVFVDIEADSFNIDPTLIEAAITPKTKAIVPVHIFGRAADMGAINAIAKRHNLPVIEDAAQSIGADFGGVRAGGLGDLGCFSFFPAKNLGCFGDGGLVTTRDADLAARVRALRNHGGARKYMHDEVGGNFRLDTLQAAILRVKLPELEGWTATRQDNAARYDGLLRQAGLEGPIALPPAGMGRHVWNQYVIRVHDGRRNDLVDALRAQKIGCAVYYPRPLNLQPCFEDLNQGVGSFPVSEQACHEVIALPIAPGITAAHQDEVVQALAAFLGD